MLAFRISALFCIVSAAAAHCCHYRFGCRSTQAALGSTQWEDPCIWVQSRTAYPFLSRSSTSPLQAGSSQRHAALCASTAKLRACSYPNAGDIIYTFTPSQPPAAQQASSSSSNSAGRPSHLQYFWEAFPAGTGPADRTTYMFTYLDAHPDRPSLEDLLEDYWRLMPEYQVRAGMRGSASHRLPTGRLTMLSWARM
jgi:hypothetical protein